MFWEPRVTHRPDELFHRDLHALFAVPEGRTVRRRPFAAGIPRPPVELRSWGHVRLPPSIGEDDFIVEWVPNHEPWTIPLALAPDGLVGALSETPAGTLSVADEEHAAQVIAELRRVCPRFARDYEVLQAGELDDEQRFRWLTVLASLGGADPALAFSLASPDHSGRWEDELARIIAGEYRATGCVKLGCFPDEMRECGNRKRYNGSGQVNTTPADHPDLRRLGKPARPAKPRKVL